MRHSTLLCHLVRGFIAACPILAAALPPAAAGAQKPNVILIMADDLGYHDLGCQGHPSIRTPVLDKLAAGGLRLTHFHSGATVCTPSRMALLTGAYPVRLGWTQGVAGYLMGFHEGMSTDALTLADIFQAENHTTGISGKWHIGNIPESRPLGQGFQHAYFLTHSNNQVKDIRRGEGDVAEAPFDNRLLTERFTTEAVNFIHTHHGNPFFLYIPYTAPHFPVEAHPDWKGRSNFGAYGDVVEELDFRVGEIIAALDKLKLTERTIIVFTSDNGPNPNEPASPLPFRGEKWSALEGGTRVPCLISYPGTIPAGTTSDALLGAIDLLPTLCQAAGISLSRHAKDSPIVDGISAWDLFTGKSAAPPRDELLHWHGKDAAPRAISVGDWKLFLDRSDALTGSGTGRATAEQVEALAPLRASLATGGAGSPALFHLAKDPGELTDLSQQFPERVEEMTQRARALTREIHSSRILPLSGSEPEKAQ